MRKRTSLFVVVCLGTSVGLWMGACGGEEATDSSEIDSTTAPSVSTTEPGGVAVTTSTSVPASDITRSKDVLPIVAELDLPYTAEFALDVYYPEAPGPWPVAVVFHGGEESKSQIRNYASQVAKGGVVVFVPEYSSTPDQLSDRLHAGAEDAVCAMHYARVHASDFGGTGESIVTAGHSYGANVAALMMLAGDQFEGDCLVNDDMSALSDGLVGLDGLYDFTALPRSLGFYDYYTVEEMQHASAITYVGASRDGSLTAQLFTGRETEGQDQAALFQTRLVDAGYEVEVIAQPELSHGAFASGAPGTVEALIAAASG